MIHLSILIPEESDDKRAVVKIAADEFETLEIEAEQLRMILQRCKCGCKERFVTDHANQLFKDPKHRRHFNNQARRKNPALKTPTPVTRRAVAAANVQMLSGGGDVVIPIRPGKAAKPNK